ncbi:RhsC-like protein [Actinoplanes sp. SE50]|uniref:DUF6531 domain-containing protein n=1 Tax=unclassified Actinoplanes TaxID=2626549 RepID=UPI00023EBD45|nr:MULTISPECIES: DUF6531 domain-containing protein [unclassified Actinoplanes]AEV84534.1 RhsC-like protein [Actinoplanes sp. SE50/110]ATO82926.1 RhsC-like protein [Actinoplanes sp. SE50]SLM00334.1 RhsC-like protein [Actinoplanes sp. SE50/110]
MPRPSDWWVLDLDADPTPGEPANLVTTGNRLLDFADDAHRAQRAVDSLQGDGAVLTWIGQSGDAFREQFGELPAQLRKVYDSHRMAGDALHAFAPRLEAAQAMADRALADGRAAREQLTGLTGQLQLAQGDVTAIGQQATALQQHTDPDPEQVKQAIRDSEAAKQRLADVQGRVASGQQALNAAKSLAEQARQLRDGAAQECKREIAAASDAGIQPRSFWQKLGEFLKGLWDVVCEVAKWVALVAGIIAMIIGGPLAWIALAAGAVLLVKAIVDFAQGKGSITDLLFAVLGIIPGVRGLTSLSRLSALYKAGGLKAIAQAALTSMKNTVRGLATTVTTAARGVVDVVKTGFSKLTGKINKIPVTTSKRTFEIPACGDPVDVSTGRVFLPETDLDLPGSPPLLLERTHRSDYRSGRLFGVSWASTLDQRIVVESDAVHMLAADGTLLTYPVPGAEGPVVPGHGRSLPLRRSGDGFLVTDPATGRSLLFAAPVADPEPDLVAPLLPREVLPESAGTVPSRTAELVAIVDREGGRIEVLRDGRGAPVEVRHGDGRRIAVTTEDGQITALHLVPATGGEPVLLRTFGYADGHLVTVAGPAGQTMRFGYDGDGRMIRWDDSNGQWYAYTYDADGRCVLGEGRDGYFGYRFDYDPDQRRTSATDSLGHTTVYQLNEDLQVVAETDPLGNTTRSEWDSQHRLLSRTDPLGRTTRFLYDADGGLEALLRPDGSSAKVVHRGGRIAAVTVTGDDGRLCRRDYGRAEAPDPTVDPLGAGPRPAERHRAGTTAPARASDPASPRMLVGGAGPAVSVEARDGFGRISALGDTTGRRIVQGWTVDGQPAWRENADGDRRQWRYDAEGNAIAHTDELGRTTRTEYGPFDLPVATVTPSGARTTYDYDTELRLIRVTNPAGLQWHYRYDPAGRLIEEADFDGRLSRYTRDPAGQLTRLVNAAGESFAFEYDVLGNLIRRTAVSPTETRTTTFRYDAVGHLVEAIGPDAVLEITRDAFGRVTAESINGRAITHAYDDSSRTVTRETPAGVGTLWSFDPDGFPIGIRMAGHEVALFHDAGGRPVAERLDESVTVVRQFDAGDRLVRQRLSDGAGAEVERAFGYREDGSLTLVDDSREGVTVFRLDDEGRVTAVDGPGRREDYRYDAAGEVVEASASVAGATVPGDRRYQGTQLVEAGGIEYRYDPAGRLVQRRDHGRVWTFRWDADGRLHGVITPDGGRWRYRYDPLGRRIATQRLTDGPADAPLDGPVLNQTDFAWDGPVLVEESDATGRTVTWQHDLDGSRPLVQVDGDRLHLLICDPNGAPTDLVAADGTVIRGSAPSLWGHHAGAGTPLRFPGQYADAETGLYYNLHRYYDPRTGRYLSPDPLGLSAGPSPVRYVDDPLLQNDPLGLSPRSCTIGKRPRYDDDAPTELDDLLNDPEMLLAGSALKKFKISAPPKTKFPTPPGNLLIGDMKTALAKYDSDFANASLAKFHGPQDQSAVLSDVFNIGSKTPKLEGWSVEWLNKFERTGGVSDYLKNADVENSWVRGHLLNEDFGFTGHTHNFAPMTTMGNNAFKNGFEQRVKDAFVRMDQLQRLHPQKFDQLGSTFTVDIRVTPSREGLFDGVPGVDVAELAIPKHIRVEAQYMIDGKPLPDSVLKDLNSTIWKERPVKPLPSNNTMNPVTGEWDPPVPTKF